MTQRLIKNFALLIDKNNTAQIISNCMTFTDLQIIEFETEKWMQAYIKTNKLKVEKDTDDTAAV